MFDIHSHILPGIDDGSPDIAVSLEMARMAVANGVTVQACTPHILPGVYNNSGPQIRKAIAALQQILDQEGISLRLVTGADVHLVPDLVGGLRSGHLLTLADTRYVLVEPPHHLPPQRLVEQFFNIMVAGYHPVLTHPERLRWIETHYPLMEQLAHGGVWMQITASSLTGSFGRNPQKWAHRMLDEGLVHVIASDSHDARRRPPNLLEGFEFAARRVGEAEATHMVLTRPACILENNAPSTVPPPLAQAGHSEDSHEKHASRATGPSKPYRDDNGRPVAQAGAGGGLRGLLGGLRRYVSGKR